ncbi:MAG TPA: phosphoglucosamine mutase [Dictyoglomaceae bacterium]|nr:phosphoglucosamine mutase [Dictyoglomaceae bacterium]HOL38801.1 phosphoglucosamine mutase [Dictyoglomaceae bacterium]HPP15451.1 phosphoglucosamine mutase [Dictyoglomaceae bacterium]HPU43228.1 phosphoglucosamine mutase [Dictyoglomaceae bacterium]
MRRYFGTDGIRGVINENLTPELAFKLGRALVGFFEDVAGKKVIIVRDTRVSGDMLKSALIAGLTSGGVDILDAGILPTSAVSYLVTLDPDVFAGIVISASHNPSQYNGIKIFANDGFKLRDEIEEKLESFIDGEDKFFRVHGTKVGKVYNFVEGKDIYINYLKKVIGEKFDDLKVMVDCAYGAASEVAPKLLEELGIEVLAYNTSYNGVNINENCGAVYPDFGRELFLKSGAQIGFTYDGDADRVLVFSEDGRIVDGDMIIGIFAGHLKENGRLKGNKVVGTEMTNSGLERYLKEREIELIRTKVGDRYILEKLIQEKLNLGGETSGHIILFDYLPTGDGLLTSLFLLKILKNTDKKLENYIDEIPIFPQLHEKVHLGDYKITKEDENKMRELTEEVISGKNIRYIVRKSGTEPIVRITLEGEIPKEELELLLAEVKKKILDYLSKSART